VFLSIHNDHWSFVPPRRGRTFPGWWCAMKPSWPNFLRLRGGCLVLVRLLRLARAPRMPPLANLMAHF
jgi:hypothetical protein